MHKIFLPLFFCVFFLVGGPQACKTQDKFKLRPPEPRAPVTELQQAITENQNTSSDPRPYQVSDVHQGIRDVLDRTVVKYDQDIARFDVRPPLSHCLKFLVSTFGQPVYQGKVTIHVTSNPDDNGRMTWSSRTPEKRRVLLHEYNFQEPTEFRFVVHELFHALYQSDAFIQAHPDFIVEGLAVYAEYLYRYRQGGFDLASRYIKKNTVLTTTQLQAMDIDFERPFSSYGGSDIDLMYILSGRLFFSQPSGWLSDMIPEMLRMGSLLKKRYPFAHLAEDYGLRLTEPFFSSAVGRYFVQYGVYENEAIGAAVVQGLQEKGYHAGMVGNRGKGRKILIGPYPTKERAFKARSTLLTEPDTPQDIFVVRSRETGAP